MTSFLDFGLAEPITRALAQEKYVTPTPIQRDAMPFVLASRDLIGIAQTGTGKTAAFALPILNRLATNPQPTEKKTCRILVLSPTRELSGQILESFRTYGRHMRLSSTLAIGGVPMGKQVRALMDGVDVLVATPGRLLDLIRGNALRLNRVEVLVLDEADRMLDMGFIHDIRKIVAKAPKQRQTVLFSATMPREIAELAGEMLHNPERVSVTPVASTVERITQRIIHTDKAAKPDLLVEVLQTEAVERALVFTRTKHGADKVVKGLAKAGIVAEAIHGNKSQGQRDRVMGNFRSGRTRILIATDIAARGIDVDGVSHVVNFDLPNEPESYVHRIGRTARAGAEGIAISFCDAEETNFLRDIERLIRISIPATGEPRRGPRPAQRSGGGASRQGPRPSQGHGAGGQRQEGRRPPQARSSDMPIADTRPVGQRQGDGGRPQRPDQERSRQDRPDQDRSPRDRGFQNRAPSNGAGKPAQGRPSEPGRGPKRPEGWRPEANRAEPAGGEARSRRPKNRGGSGPRAPGGPATAPDRQAAGDRGAAGSATHHDNIAAVAFLQRREDSHRAEALGAAPASR